MGFSYTLVGFSDCHHGFNRIGTLGGNSNSKNTLSNSSTSNKALGSLMSSRQSIVVKLFPERGNGVFSLAYFRLCLVVNMKSYLTVGALG